MAKSGVLDEKAKALNVSVLELCEKAVAEHGTPFKAALALGVYPNTIRWHLKRAKADSQHSTAEIASNGEAKSA